jgi:hypothetical protein
MLLWAAFGEQWSFNHKVNFDGENRLITLGDAASGIDIKTDIYSDWKEWVQLYDNSKFLPALRTIGGDPVGGGLYAGDLYFLINNWQIVVDKPLSVNGILYNDTVGVSPYIIQGGGGVVASVSNLAYAVSAAAGEISNGDIMDMLEYILNTMSGLATEDTAQRALNAARLAAAVSI